MHWINYCYSSTYEHIEAIIVNMFYTNHDILMVMIIIVILLIFEAFILTERKKYSTPMGFEPTRAEPIGLAVQRLNHSATASSDNILKYEWYSKAMFFFLSVKTYTYKTGESKFILSCIEIVHLYNVYYLNFVMLCNVRTLWN